MTASPYQQSRKAGRFELLLFLLGILLSRALILFAVHHATHGHEFSNDTSMLMEMLRSPFGLLTNKVHRQQHPPLLPVMEALFGYPLTFFCSDFLTDRITMILWETVLGALFYSLLNALHITGSRRTLCLLAFLALPTGWLTTAVMGEDDAIAACGFLLPLILFLNGKQVAALFASGFGFVAAKIFVALQLIGLFPFVDPDRRLRATLAGLAPVVLLYGGMTAYDLSHSMPVPLLGFKPNPYFGTNFWVILHHYEGVNLAAIGSYTGFLALGCSLIPIILLYRRHRTDWTPQALTVACAAMLLIFLSLFYHVEPEYFTIMLPLLIVTAETTGDVVCYTLVAVVPWFGKFFQNAAFMANAATNSGKAVPNKLFHEIFRSSPEAWLTADQAIFSVLTLYVSWRLCAKLWRTEKSASLPKGAMLATRGEG